MASGTDESYCLGHLSVEFGAVNRRSVTGFAGSMVAASGVTGSST